MSESLNLKPLGDRLVIEPATREEMTASGIVLPDTAKEKPHRGTVVAAGEGRRRLRRGGHRPLRDERPQPLTQTAPLLAHRHVVTPHHVSRHAADVAAVAQDRPGLAEADGAECQKGQRAGCGHQREREGGPVVAAIFAAAPLQLCGIADRREAEAKLAGLT